MNITSLQAQLELRHSLPYNWGVRQNNALDRATRFAYEIENFEEILSKINTLFASSADYGLLRDYTLNRWYNFWSAKGIEYIFSTHPRVLLEPNTRHSLIDFYIDGIAFDHKSSVFPKGYGQALSLAQTHPSSLINWMYNNQSKEQRHHYGNRLFLILHAADGAHWKLKSALSLMHPLIHSYLDILRLDLMPRHTFQPGAETMADILWVLK